MSLSKFESKYFYDPLYIYASTIREHRRDAKIILILYYSDQIELYERNFGTEKEAFGNGKLFAAGEKEEGEKKVAPS